MWRYLKYIVGLLTMAVGIVAMKKSVLGITPITSLPLALSEACPFLSLGNWTILFHIVCIIGIIFIEKKITTQTILMLPVGICFGYFIDLLLWLFPYESQVIYIRSVFLVVGIIVSCLGISLINNAGLMLPSPDGLMRKIALVYNKKYHLVKITGDCVWVVIAIAIEIACFHRLYAVGIGTIVSAIFSGRTIKFWNSLLFKNAQ